MEIPQVYIRNLYRAGLALLVVLSVFLGVGVLKGLHNFDDGDRESSISFNGHGEVNAVPDIASVTFSVESSKDTQSAASDEVNTKINKVLSFLRSSNIAERDIKTQNYSSYPKYSGSTPCPVYFREGIMPPCPAQESKIIGYTVNQSIEVKIRKVDDASKIIDGLNKIGVSNMYGPSMSIDDEESLKAEARKKAIADAKQKAETLERDLGVNLGKIISFSEGGGYYPIVYDKAVTLEVGGAPSVPSEIPKGENTISSDVTITFEIR